MCKACGVEVDKHQELMDEAYIEFLETPLDLLPLVRAGTRPNLLLTRTFSKIHGLAGLRVGYGLGHPELVSALEKIRQPFNLNAMAQVTTGTILGTVRDPSGAVVPGATVSGAA